MTGPIYHLAQINIARMRDTIDSPVMAEFVANLDRINAVAESTPGFIWRLKTDDGNATSIRIYDDDYLIVNMSMWGSIESLYAFTYQSDHVEIFRRRREWFDKPELPIVAMWWVPAGHIPTAHEGKDRLDYLRQHGPTTHAFTFKQRFCVEQLLNQERSTSI